MTRDPKYGFTEVKRKGLKPRRGLSLSKKVEYRPVGKKPMTNECSTSKDKSKEASTSRQPKKDANLVKTTSVFGVFSGMDEGEKVCEELNVNHLPIDKSTSQRKILPSLMKGRTPELRRLMRILIAKRMRCIMKLRTL